MNRKNEMLNNKAKQLKFQEKDKKRMQERNLKRKKGCRP